MLSRILQAIVVAVLSIGIWTVLTGESPSPGNSTPAPRTGPATTPDQAETKDPLFKKGHVVSLFGAKISAEEADAFVKTFRDAPRNSHKMPGFLGMAVAENIKEPNSFVVLTVWENEAALTAYIMSKGFGEDHAQAENITSAKYVSAARYVVKDN